MFRLHKTVESPQLQSIKVVDFFFVVHRPIPTVFATMEILQLHLVTVVDSLVAGRALLPCRDAEACPMVQMFGQTVGIPQLLHTVINVPVYRCADFPSRGAEADPHGLVDHGDSPDLHHVLVERLPVPCVDLTASRGMKLALCCW